MKTLFFIPLLFVNIYANSCWKTQEIADFAQDELSGIARVSLKDSVTCSPLKNAKFYIGTKFYKTNKFGIAQIPLPEDMEEKFVKVHIEKDGYITTDQKMKAVFGSYWNNLFLMSKALPIESARFVLSWGDKPLDLDLHLKTNNYHISYRNTKSLSNTAKLDRDATKGYGPETITVKKLQKNEEYKILVHRYSSHGKINAKTKVQVYLNNKLDRSVRLKDTNARCIEIATIKNRTIHYTLQDLPNSACK